MGRLGDLRASGAAGVNGFAGIVDEVVEMAGDAVADVVETLGSLVRDGLARVGGAVRVGAFTAWVGAVLAGLLNVVGAGIKGVAGIVGNVPAGAVRAVGGIVLWDKRLIVRGAVDVGSSIGGAVVMLAGTAVATVQRALAAEASARPLSADERAVLQKVFRSSLATYNIRLVEGRSGAFGVNRRPFTLGNTIYLKDVDLTERPDVLVHEAVHVWQYQQHGSRYTTDALGAQVRYGYRGRGAYDWEAELARGRGSWTEFNAEAQGRFIQDVWASGRGAFFDQPGTTRFTVASDGSEIDHTALAVDATAVLQGRRNLRASRLVLTE